MKKLMIALAAVALAGAAMASSDYVTVNWASMSSSHRAYTAYVMKQGSDVASLFAAGSAAAAFAELDSDKVSSAVTANSTAEGSFEVSAASLTWTGSTYVDTYDMFLVSSDQSEWIAGLLVCTYSKKATLPILTEYSVTGVETSFANDNWNATEPSSDVPEPTGGLLMLVGMAGLALRRKRA